MSLRTKILFLFLLLAIAPLLAVAGSAYVQSQSAVRDLMEVRIATLARYAAEDLGSSFGRLDAQVQRLAEDETLQTLVAAEPGSEGRARALRVAEARLDDLWPYVAPNLVSVAIHGSDGELLRRARDPAEDGSPSACLWDPTAGKLTVTRPLRGADGGSRADLVATVNAMELVRPEVLGAYFGGTSSLYIVERSTESTIPITDCDVPFDAATLLSRARTKDGIPVSTLPSGSRFAFDDADGTERFASFVELQVPAWTVVVTGGMNDFLGPFREIQHGYALFVALVALSTALAFTLSINQVMRSLEDLGDAADRIGRGELDPWLPPPSQDEVGRLSHAVGRMAERIRQMVRQVDRSSRMAVVGELASYLAHEIRNPLSSIKLNLQSLSREVDEGTLADDASHEIEVCLREVGRLERVVSSVLRLGNARPGHVEARSVHELLEETVELIRPELDRYGVDAELSLEASDPTVHGDFAQLKGVFLNLLLNAADAMPDGGTIHVRTENRGGTPPLLLVSVMDEGPGVAPELRERIFEPFFTTKPTGSGIGLSLAAKAVEDHAGRIYLMPPTGVNDGASFAVELPLWTETVADPPNGLANPLPTPSREARLAPAVHQGTKDP